MNNQSHIVVVVDDDEIDGDEYDEYDEYECNEEGDCDDNTDDNKINDRHTR